EVSFRRFQQVGVKPNGFIINDMKEGSSYYPYYGYAYNRSGSEPKSHVAWMDGYQAVVDRFGKRHERDYLPAVEFSEETDDSVRV
ncbi:MAG: capsular biosynthesis protein, partial [Methylovulum sp.]